MSTLSGSARRTPKLAVEVLEDRTVPTFLTKTGLTPALAAKYGGESIAIGNIVPEAGQFQTNEYVLGTGPGRESLVRLLDLNGKLLGQFVPYVGFKGGINVALGDVTGDGNLDIVVSAASGLTPTTPQVKVFNAAGGLLSQFNVFSTGYLGGISIAVGNVLGGIGTGNNGTGGFGGGGFGGGGGNQTFKSEIIAGASLGNNPHVVVTDEVGNIARSFLAFSSGYLGGVSLAAANVDSTSTPGSTGGGGGGGGGGGFGGGGGGLVANTNAYSEIVVGAATNVPHVKVLDVWQAGNARLDGPGGVNERLSYFAFDPALGRGVTVAAGNTDGNAGAEVYVGLIGDTKVASTTIRAFSGEGALQLAEFQAFPNGYSRVVNMAVGNVTPFDPNNFAGNFFNIRDLAIVAGDGLLDQQVPRVFFGVQNSVAGLNGP